MKLTARAAYDDCLQFFKSISDLIEAASLRAGSNRPFGGRLDPGSGFEVTLTVTHGALPAFVTRYPHASFTFHEERQPLPNVPTTAAETDPLGALSVTFTLDFTPYGTIFGGSSDDDGGTGTTAGRALQPVARPFAPPTPSEGPSFGVGQVFSSA